MGAIFAAPVRDALRGPSPTGPTGSSRSFSGRIVPLQLAYPAVLGQMACDEFGIFAVKSSMRDRTSGYIGSISACDVFNLT